jgi:hypothetical protein
MSSLKLQNFSTSSHPLQNEKETSFSEKSKHLKNPPKTTEFKNFVCPLALALSAVINKPQETNSPDWTPISSNEHVNQDKGSSLIILPLFLCSTAACDKRENEADMQQRYFRGGLWH